jgi:hypothetical protein
MRLIPDGSGAQGLARPHYLCRRLGSPALWAALDLKSGSEHVRQIGEDAGTPPRMPLFDVDRHQAPGANQADQLPAPQRKLR